MWTPLGECGILTFLGGNVYRNDGSGSGQQP